MQSNNNKNITEINVATEKYSLFDKQKYVVDLCKDKAMSSPNLTAILDVHHRYLSVNNQYKRQLSYKNNVIKGSCVSETFDISQYNEVIKPCLDECVRTKENQKIKLTIYNDNKDEMHFDTVCKYSENNGGSSRFYLYLRDITLYQDKINKLEKEKYLLNEVVNKVPNLISVRDAAGKFILVNEAISHVYGQNANDMIGKGDEELSHQPWNIESCIEINTMVMQQKQERTILEETITDRHGNKLWLQTTKQPFIDHSNNELYILGVSTNITQHRMAKEKLIQSEKRFKDFAETAANIFWELDKDLNYTYISGSIKNLIGDSSIYPLGKGFETLFINSSKCEFDIKAYNEILKQKRNILNFTFNVKNDNREVDIFRINAKPIFNSSKKFEGYRGVIRNITEEKALLERIAYDAKHDSLTGLVNRKEFDKQLERMLNKAKESDEDSILCYLDLDHFKIVNDAAGHRAGDQLLIRLAHILEDKVRASDIVARLGGDEFGIILERCPLNNAIQVCENILRSINQFVFVWDKQSFKIGVSIGVAMISDKSSNEALILSQADMACYRAKELGRNQMHIAHTDDTAIIERSSEFAYVSAITDALNNDRLFLMKQPIVAVSDISTDIPHYEVLSRILDVKENIIPPNEFIRVAERYGMISSVDRFVIKKAFQYHMLNYRNTSVIISINLSGNTVSDPYILDFIKSEIEKYKLDPRNVCFEITETAAISSITKAINVIKELKEIGVKFALDDFGSGLSSFGYLKDLPVDFLKIDGAFVKNMVNNDKDRAIVRSINEIAKVMGMQTIAEFVENCEILEILKDIGIDYAQGYGIGEPERVG
jgi:diguanylate cyclase (GGDEF)-like protein/PAS domain S-box-containing protein